MKNLLLVLMLITFTFTSCSSDDDGSSDEVVSPFAGTWSGTFDGDDTGTWILVISNSGDFESGSAYSNNANQTEITVSGTLTADGAGTSLSENGTMSTSQISGETITGTWINPNQGNISGTSTGSRQ